MKHTIKDMTIEQFVREYNITLAAEDKMAIRNVRPQNAEAVKAYATEHKPEIIDYLKAEQEKKEAEKAAEAAKLEERRKKIAGIRGLKELEAAAEAWEDYRDAFARMMERGDARAPKAPEMNIPELKAKYPRAAAYLTAEHYAQSDNAAKRSAGRKALEKIINGEDYKKAVEDMDKEWADYCAAHMWD